MTDPVEPGKGSQPTQPSQPAGSSTSSGKGWSPKPLNWLGMHFDEEQTKKLWDTITQTIGNQINHDKAKALEALKKLRADNDENN